jgi:hypothetical protein
MTTTHKLQDIFVVGADGQIYLLSEDVYRDPKFKLSEADAKILRLGKTGHTIADVYDEDLKKLVWGEKYAAGYFVDLSTVRSLKPPVTFSSDESSELDGGGEAVDDNLYIVPNDNPEAVFYLDQATVRAVVEQDPSDVSVIQKHFKKDDVASLTDEERQRYGMHGACYIVNLSSFRSKGR